MAEELSEEPTPEARAWAEYLAWTRNAIPDQYEATEQRAWERLERQLPALIHLEIPSAPPS